MSVTFNEAYLVIMSVLSGDSFEMNSAFRTDGAWLVGGIITVLGAMLITYLYRKSAWLEANLEKYMMVVAYLLIAVIIFVEVFRRFVMGVQAPWSTTLPPFLFLIMTWAGCAYNVKLRTHLSFSEFRTKMPRGMQLGCLTLDAVLWIGFAIIVVVTSSRVVANSAANFQILLGTDNVLQWWLLISVPISFILLAGRALENYMDDVANYRSGAPLIVQPSLSGN